MKNSYFIKEINWLTNKTLDESLKQRLNAFMTKHKNDIRSGAVGAYIGSSLGAAAYPTAVVGGALAPVAVLGGAGALAGGALGVAAGRALRKYNAKKEIKPASSFDQPRNDK